MPALRQLARDESEESVFREVTRSLISPAAIPGVLEFLQTAAAPGAPGPDLPKRYRLRDGAIDLLGRMGPNAKGAVPTLIPPRSCPVFGPDRPRRQSRRPLPGGSTRTRAAAAALRTISGREFSSDARQPAVTRSVAQSELVRLLTQSGAQTRSGTRLLAQSGGQVRPGADSMGEEFSADKEVRS